MNDKVMIAIPIYDGAYEYLDEFIAGLRAIDYDNFDVMFSVNGNSKKIVKKIKELIPTLDFLWSIHETKKGKDAHQSIYNSMKQLRKVFLGVGDYDWMLVLEADIVPYPDILKEFVEARYPVMGCPYKLSDKMMMINIFTPWGRNENIKIKDYNSNYINQLYVRVWSCGFGCTIIKNWVIKKVPFRLSEEGKCVDTAFAEDMVKNDITVYCKMDREAKHLRV